MTPKKIGLIMHSSFRQWLEENSSSNAPRVRRSLLEVWMAVQSVVLLNTTPSLFISTANYESAIYLFDPHYALAREFSRETSLAYRVEGHVHYGILPGVITLRVLAFLNRVKQPYYRTDLLVGRKSGTVSLGGHGAAPESGISL